MTTPQLDPVSLVVAIAGSLLGPVLAPYVGAYTVILFGWAGGLLIGLYRRDPASRLSTARFTAVTLILTIGATTVAADFLSSKVSVGASLLLFPIAFLIPAIGHSWLDIGAWAVRRVATMLGGGQ